MFVAKSGVKWGTAAHQVLRRKPRQRGVHFYLPGAVRA